jgi:phosphohistidine phosphatase SixA
LFASCVVLGRFVAEWGGALAVGGPCVSGDVNGDGLLNITDPVHLLRFLFQAGPAPVACAPPAAECKVSTIIVVRHAERDGVPGADPCLNPDGQARAQRLAAALAPARIDFLIASQYCRTRQTIEPAAAPRGLTIEQIAEAADVVARLKALPEGSVAAVAHHSFTIHDILIGLGIPEEAATAIRVGTEYDNLIVVLRPSGGAAPKLLHLKY